MTKIVFAAIAVAAAVYFVMPSDDSAMAECQKRHSFDTCFRMLNR